MPASDRAIDRGTALAARHLRELGGEFRERRMSLGESQAFVAAAARLSRPRYSRVEAGLATTLSVLDLNRIASVLGLDVSLRLFPGGVATRDAGHAGKLSALLGHVRSPLRSRLEVPLPQAADRFERRAWDAVLFGRGLRTALELEMRLRDVQATLRRHQLKRRDDPVDGFLLLVANTKHNAGVLDAYAVLFEDLPRLRPGVVWAALEAGVHPPSGLLVL